MLLQARAEGPRAAANGSFVAARRSWGPELPGQLLKGNTPGDYHSCPGQRWDQQYAHAMAETAYGKCGYLSLAYQVFGDGPVELVFVGPMVTHIELFWTLPEFKAFFDQLATFCRVLLFDKAGVGLSDPIPKVRLLEDRAAEIEAVKDAVGFAKAAVFGMSEGGPQAIMFAAKRPERTRALILIDTIPYWG